MKLSEWIWNKRLTVHKFAQKYNLSYQTVLAITKNTITPRMATALYILKLTNGDVTIKSMMSTKDSEALSEKISDNLSH